MGTNVLPVVDNPDTLRVKCAAPNCERLAYDGSAFCGECMEAQAAQAAVIWHGKDAIPNKRAELESALDLEEVLASERPVEELMPATVCSRCEAAIAAGEYRVSVFATERQVLNQRVDVETIIRTLCLACTMDPDEFLTGHFRTTKLDIEARAKWAASPAERGADVLDNKRANTGHGGQANTDGAPVKEDLDGEALGAADAEANELSEWAGFGHGLFRSDMAPTNPRSEESVRRETLRMFLNDRARSWGKLRPQQREAVKLYVEGLNQNEIARRMGLKQYDVSRMIQSALNLARSN